MTYKITMKCGKGDEYELSPHAAGKMPNDGQFFVRYTYTKNAALAAWYRNRVGVISVEEVDDAEFVQLAEHYTTLIDNQYPAEV